MFQISSFEFTYEDRLVLCGHMRLAKSAVLKNLYMHAHMRSNSVTCDSHYEFFLYRVCFTNHLNSYSQTAKSGTT